MGLISGIQNKPAKLILPMTTHGDVRINVKHRSRQGERMWRPKHSQAMKETHKLSSMSSMYHVFSSIES